MTNTVGKKFVIAQLLVLSVLYSYALAGGKVKNIWAAFVLEPNETNYQACQKQIDNSLSGKYEPLKSPTYLQLMENKLIGKVLKLIDSGNSYAADLCFQFHPLFYGHAALQEFFDIHLGKLIKKDPELFLKLFRKNVYKNKKYTSDVDGLLLNYGDEFVDKFEKQLKETQERIDALKRVKGENYKEVRDYCIEILKKRPGFKEKP